MSKNRYNQQSTTAMRPAATRPIINSKKTSTPDLIQKPNRIEGRTLSDTAASTEPEIYYNLQTKVRRSHLLLSQQSMIGSGMITGKLKWLTQSKRYLSVSRKAMNCRFRSVILCHVCAAQENEIRHSHVMIKSPWQIRFLLMGEAV